MTLVLPFILLLFSLHSVSFDLNVVLQNITNAVSKKYDGQSIVTAVKNTHWNINIASEHLDPLLGRKPSLHSRFLYGSGTKPLTASIILRLVEQGALQLNDTIVSYVNPFLRTMAKHHPEMPFRSLEDVYGSVVSNMTIFQLATMTYGVKDFDAGVDQRSKNEDFARKLSYARPDYYITPIDLLDVTKFPYINATWDDYSSTNYVLLGMVLARVTGAETWEDFDQAKYLPHGINVKFLSDECPSDVKDYIAGFDVTTLNNLTEPFDTSPVKSDTTGWTASNLEGTVEEVNKLYYEIYGPTDYLSSSSRSIMTHYFSSNEAANANLGYGFGTMNLTLVTNMYNYGHFGETYGYTSAVIYVPSIETSFGFSSNRESEGLAILDVICPYINAVVDYINKLPAKRNCIWVTDDFPGHCHCTP